MPSGRPLITPVSTLNPAMCYTAVIAIGDFLTIWPLLDSGWPQLTPARPLTPSMHYTLVWGPFYRIWWPQGISKECDLWLTPADPCMTLDPSNELHFEGFFLPNLVAIHHFWAIWPLVDPGWPLHDHWPQQCITLWSGVLPNKFGGHRALLSKLTPTWPQLTPSWLMTQAMHYTLVRDSSYQIWWLWDISKQFDL